MKLKELISTARIVTDDINPDEPLWTDAEWTVYANDAEREACRRADLLYDELDPIAVKANQPAYTVPGYVKRVIRAKLDSMTVPLKRTTRYEQDRLYWNWDLLTGQPDFYITEIGQEFLLVRLPLVDDTLRIIVVRYPVNQMSAPDDSPEIDEAYHLDLVDWMCARAYMKDDADTQNIKKAEEYEAKFTLKFGPRPTARTELFRKRMPLRGDMWPRIWGL
jgi:hypothetical protein